MRRHVERASKGTGEVVACVISSKPEATYHFLAVVYRRRRLRQRELVNDAVKSGQIINIVRKMEMPAPQDYSIVALCTGDEFCLASGR